MSKESIEFDEMRVDFIRELGNIGGASATTSLSILLNAQVKMSIPDVNILEFNELTEILGGTENLVVAVMSPIVGELNGIIMLVLEEEKAKNLADLLVEEKQLDFSELDLSALNEIGNILISTYLSALESLTNFKVRTVPPQLCIDMAGAILSVPAIEFGKDGDRALVIKSGFSNIEENISGYMILISDVHSYDKMYDSLGVR